MDEHGYGYTDRQISENTHEIQVRGNYLTTHATLENHFHRRAQELCFSKNYKSDLSQKVTTKIVDGELKHYYYQPTTVSSLPYVTGTVTCQGMRN